MIYINPPKGQVALHILENSVFTRLEYLRLLDNDKTDSFNGNSEYLLENSMWDRIGHFTLRLIAAASNELWLFFVRSEELLLKQRLDHSSVRQVHRLFRNIIRQLQSRDCCDTPITKGLMEMSEHLLSPQVFKHILKRNHAVDCRKHQCRVPFSAVPDLVKDRKIDLYRGNATISCSEWKTALLCLYRNFILEEKSRISHARYLVSTEPRLMYMSKVICGQSLDTLPQNGSITSKNINDESSKFPPCMQHLHTTLRDKHRLSHHARFHYSLFLKECGMKLQDAIDYWREEYTKPHTCQSGCTHSWQTSEKKFLYSIRHLYGLEGGRKDYKTPNCRMIGTDVPGLRYEGGCPFKHFDANKLESILPTFMNDAEIKGLKNIESDNPEVACSAFLKIVHKREGEDFVIHSPVQYYTKVVSRA